jgi:hypothetical protein
MWRRARRSAQPSDGTMTRHRIYVPLHGDPAALRVAEAVASGEGRFKLVGGPAPGDCWQFGPGEVVECAAQSLADGSRVLVAVSSASADQDYRKRRMVFGVAGAAFGSLAGAVVGFWVHPSVSSLAVGALVGAVTAAVLSIRWGDAAWRMWSRWMSSDWWAGGW